MDTEHNVEVKRQTPLPYGQLFQVLAIQSAEPITATVIYPFITQLVRSTGITNGDEAKVGYYAGIIESTFFISESLTCYQWGVASDKYGRKPILLLGPLGLALATISFGLSRTFWPLVAFRAAQGVFNGNIGVSKTVVAELTDSTNMADAYMMIPIMWAFGVTFGPMIGGMLAEPAQNWPNTLGTIQLFIDFPYFLPCLVAGIWSFVAFIVPLFGLKETNPAFKCDGEAPDKTQPLPSETQPLLHDSDTTVYDATVTTATIADRTIPEPEPSTSILNPTLTIVLVNYSLLTFTDMSYTVLIPLVFSTSHSLGGLELSTKLIGTIMGTYSFLNGFIQIGVLKPLLKRLGPRRMYQIAYASIAIPLVMLMCEQMLINRYGKVTAGVWVAIVIQFTVATLTNTAYSAASVLIVEAASPKTLGSVNGLAQALASGFRGLAPSVASSLFALSLQSQLLGGYFVYAILIGVVVIGTICTTRLPRHLS